MPETDGSTPSSDLSDLAAAIAANTAAVRELTATIQAGRPAETTSLRNAECRMQNADGGQAGVRAGAARGSEPIGTPVALNVTLKQESTVRPFVKPLPLPSPLPWEKLTDGHVSADEVRTESIRFRCAQILKVVICKPGKKWRLDRRLVFVAAVLAARIDAVSADGQAGTRWLNTALDAVREFPSDNLARHFQWRLKDGLGELDPVMHDKATAHMLWIQLCKTIEVPRDWLAEELPEQERVRRQYAEQSKEPRWTGEDTAAARRALQTGEAG